MEYSYFTVINYLWNHTLLPVVYGGGSVVVNLLFNFPLIGLWGLWTLFSYALLIGSFLVLQSSCIDENERGGYMYLTLIVFLVFGDCYCYIYTEANL